MYDIKVRWSECKQSKRFPPDPPKVSAAHGSRYGRVDQRERPYGDSPIGGSGSTLQMGHPYANPSLPLAYRKAFQGKYTGHMSNAHQLSMLTSRTYQQPIIEADVSTVTHYSDNQLLFVLNLLFTIISSLLPISSIVALYFVPDLLTRLGMIAGLTAFFSLCLACLTDARRVEIVTATTAYATRQGPVLQRQRKLTWH